MNGRLVHIAVVLSAMAFGPSAWAQEEAHAGSEEEGRHEVALLIGHAFMGHGLNADGNRTWIAEPSWGLNYNYWIGTHWAIGLHTDFVNEDFVVEDFEHHVLERDRPIAPALVATYRPHEHWSFIAGGGMEFASEENLALVRVGTEYSIHLSGAWETVASLDYDLRVEAYDSFMLALGIARRF